MTSKFADIYLRNVCKYMYKTFYDMILSELKIFSKRKKILFALDANHVAGNRIIDVDILGIEGGGGVITLYVLVTHNCKIKDLYQMILIFSTNGDFYKKMIGTGKANIVDFDDIIYYDDRIDCEYNLRIQDIIHVEYMKKYSGNITIIYGTNITNSKEKNIYKYNNLFVDRFTFSNAIENKISCEYRKKHFDYHRLKNNINLSFAFTNSVCGGLTYRKEKFDGNDGHSIFKFTTNLAGYFTEIICMFCDEKITSLSIELLNYIYNENELLLANKINAKEMEKILYINLLFRESKIIDKSTRILNKYFHKHNCKHGCKKPYSASNLFEGKQSYSACSSEPLPILLLRAVVYEHTLMLYRKLTQT